MKASSSGFDGAATLRSDRATLFLFISIVQRTRVACHRLHPSFLIRSMHPTTFSLPPTVPAVRLAALPTRPPRRPPHPSDRPPRLPARPSVRTRQYHRPPDGSAIEHVHRAVVPLCRRYYINRVWLECVWIFGLKMATNSSAKPASGIRRVDCEVRPITVAMKYRGD